MDYRVIWFIFWALLWTVYFVLDGLDFGAGMLQRFIARDMTERRMVMHAVGPVWDGNEVWLISAAGATFAAFPAFYAVMFSSLYAPLMLVLFSLILRGAAFEFRGKVVSNAWQGYWDAVILCTSVLAPLLFGVIFGNLFRGLPIDNGVFRGTFRDFLHPYAITIGALFVLLFAQHGVLWLGLRTGGDLHRRAGQAAAMIWIALAFVAAGSLVWTAFLPYIAKNYRIHPALGAVPAFAAASLIAVRLFCKSGRYDRALLASSVTIAALMVAGMAGLYPNLLISSIDPQHNLTIYNAASSTFSLRLMTITAILILPLIITYQFWVYRVFHVRLTATDTDNSEEAY